jgi:uncharacterized protein (DUF1800 family)
MSAKDAFIAANRFGLGARPGELGRVAADPRGAVLAQIATPELPAPFRGLPSTGDILNVHFAGRRSGDPNGEETYQKPIRAKLVEAVAARARAQVRSAMPFQERLMLFWSNHFAVSLRGRPVIGALAVNYENEAIRPHLFGKFAAMLAAVARHPAMLMYLDNFINFGPNSEIARRNGRGLNENLAREILELHTLGVQGGYTQADVTEFAKILSGWSIEGLGQERGEPQFKFRPYGHEPGAKTLLGKTYEEAGETEGAAALEDLAAHPSTAKFVAAKLARHFVADDPPEAATGILESVFRETGGDLAQLSRTLVRLDEAWRDPLAKVKTAEDLIVSALRAIAADDVPDAGLFGSYRELSQFPFSPPSPAGWPDEAAAWISPETLMRRIEWARALASRIARGAHPADLFERTIAPVASDETRFQIGAAASAEDGIAMVFASPEFQRR